MALSERPTVKTCRTCGEEIKAQARKCVHCGAYQDWRGAVSLSTTVLSLMVALISVSIAAFPAIRKAVTPARSLVDFAFQGGDEDTVSAFVQNTGSQPATVNGARLRTRRGANVVEFGLTSANDGPTAGRPISAGARELVVYRFSGRYETRRAADAKAGCTLALTVTNYNSHQQTIERAVACDRLAGFASAHDPMR